MTDVQHHLLQLEGSGLVRRAGDIPELEYLFQHALVQEAAYESLLKADRRRLHQDVAETLETIHHDHLEEYYGRLAYHYRYAEARAETFAYLIKAAEYSLARFANATAVQYYSDALTLTAPESPDRFGALLARAKIYDLMAARQLQAQDLQALQAMAEKANNDAWRAKVAVQWGHYSISVGESLAAADYGRQAIQFAQLGADVESEARGRVIWGYALVRMADLDAARAQCELALMLVNSSYLPRVKIEILRQLGVIFEIQGQYAQAASYVQQALALGRQLDNRRAEGMCLNSLGVISFKQGNYSQAWSYYEQSLAIRRELGDRYGEGIVLINLGEMALRNLGDYETAEQHFAAVERLSRETNDSSGILSAFIGRGNVHLSLGDYETAASSLQQALQLAQTLHDRESECNILGSLAELQLGLGDKQAAYRLGQQCVALAEEIGALDELGSGLNRLGWVLMDSGRLEEANSVFQKSLKLRRELGQPGLALLSLAGLAEIARQHNDLALAMQNVEPILDYIEAYPFNTLDEPFKVLLTAYYVLRAKADRRAVVILRQAREQLLARAALITDPVLRQSFLTGVPHHRELLALPIE